MPDKDSAVANDLVVGIDYTLRLEDGQVVDTSEDRDPLEFLQGHGQIVPGLEQALALDATSRDLRTSAT